MCNLARKTHFQNIQCFKVQYAPVSISQYISQRTGMHVVIADQKGPKVRGYFTLATEIFDDSGAPHTLEHLVFMGSRSYKYKGLLDKMAQRAYSDTNAWTAVDHTVYTLDTAGWEGFAQILPVYLEHVILPTLTDEGCYTEVHHIDGQGNDAGVVYSEMQGIQNTGPEIMDNKARKLLYPDTVGFRYETGGFMEQLRDLTADRIRAFHKEMYQPKNLCLVLTGEIDKDHLFQILDDFEEGILDHIPKPKAPFKRPWVESAQPPPLAETVVETVQFPEEDETSGEALIGMFGPDCRDSLQTAALNVFLSFLCGSSVSVLENAIVEKEELASSVGYDIDPRPKTVIWFQPTGVATDNLALVERRIFEILKEVASKPLDMTYLTACLKRVRRQVLFTAESSGHFYANEIINDFLFGKRDGSELKDLGSVSEYDILETWTENEWKEFLKMWFIDAHHVSVLGVPSSDLAQSLKTAEEARIAEQKKSLGENGLKKKAEVLEAAIAKNNVAIPESLLQKWPVPGVDSIHFIKSTTARSGLAKKLGKPKNNIQKIIDAKADLPLFIQFEHVPTNFVHLVMLFGTSNIAMEHLPLLPLFTENFFNTPIMRHGVKINFEQVVTHLEQDTIEYSMMEGSKIGYPEGVAIFFKVEPEKYAAAIQWLRTLIFDSIFDIVRLKASLSKIIADIPESKRSGNAMMSAVDAMIHLDSRSSVKAQNTLVKVVYMKRLKKVLENDPNTVISWLEALRKQLFTFSNVRTLVVANIETLPEPVNAWKALMSKLPATDFVLPIIKQKERLSHEGKNTGEYGVVVVSMPTIDSSYCSSSTKGISGFDDPVLPALLVSLSFLEAVEGPLWSAVRGTGLAYGASFKSDIDGGFLQFSVYRSPDAYRAFVASKEILEAYIDESTKFEPSALEGAISGIVVSLADEQATVATAGQMNFINTVARGLSPDFSTEMLKKVRRVQVDEIRAVMKMLLLPAFMPGKANIVVTCAPVMLENIVKDFTQAGFKTQVQSLTNFYNDYGLKCDDDAEERYMSDGDEGSIDNQDDEDGVEDEDED